MTLITRPGIPSASPIEQLHNYYEHLVLDALRNRTIRLDNDTFVDAACVALNELPAKYIRHDVDMAYFTDPQEMAAILSRVERAVDLALGRVLSRQPNVFPE
jgi:hypothetical protein